ncbi:MAG: hypothetical protein K2G70_08025 [Turicibacter sp.]|nr:hypothetical protein [Turicibacter sp.]
MKEYKEELLIGIISLLIILILTFISYVSVMKEDHVFINDDTKFLSQIEEVDFNQEF